MPKIHSNKINKTANDLKTGRPTTVFSAVFILCNSGLGAATLSMPFTFHQAGGIYASMAVMMVCAVLMAVTLVIFAYVQDYSTRVLDTLGDIALELVGPKFALITDIAMFAQLFGATAAYVLILKDQIHLLMNQIVGDSYYDEHWFVDARLIATILTAVVIFPISLKKELDFLKYPSYLVLIGIFYVVFDVFIRYFTGSYLVETVNGPDPFYKVFAAFPIILAGFSCQFNAPPVYANMKKRTLTNWTKVAISASLVCFSCYTLIGIPGYLSYGETVDSDIIKCLPHSVDATIARAMMAVAVSFHYPAAYSAGRTTLIVWIKGVKRQLCRGSESGSGQEVVQIDRESLSLLSEELRSSTVTLRGRSVTYELIENFIITLLWVATTCAIGIFVNSLDVIMGFIGSVTAHQFLILPGVILAQTSFRHKVNVNYNEDRRYESGSFRLFKVIGGIGLAGLGGFVLFQGLTSSVVNLVDPDDG